MKDLLRSNWEWDYVINLSESDYPLKSGKALVQYLTKHKGRNLVKSHGLGLEKFVKKQARVEKMLYEVAIT